MRLCRNISLSKEATYGPPGRIPFRRNTFSGKERIAFTFVLDTQPMKELFGWALCYFCTQERALWRTSWPLRARRRRWVLR